MKTRKTRRSAGNTRIPAAAADHKIETLQMKTFLYISYIRFYIFHTYVYTSSAAAAGFRGPPADLLVFLNSK